jgi:hypothetical protein
VQVCVGIRRFMLGFAGWHLSTEGLVNEGWVNEGCCTGMQGQQCRAQVCWGACSSVCTQAYWVNIDVGNPYLTSPYPSSIAEATEHSQSSLSCCLCIEDTGLA